jgi:V/A-type H+-transporting ATPase subunit E
MAEELKELINKIHQEGIKAAEDRAKDIENEARHRAQVIIEEAENKARNIILEAKEKIAKMEEGAKVSLKQAGRDLLLTLKKEINAVLGRLIVSRVREALNPEELGRIITSLIKNYSSKERGNIIVTLKKEDLEKLRKGFLNELKEELKNGIILRSSEDIQGGFIISYDGDKSHYEFTDKALAEYINLYLKPALAEILKEAVTNNKNVKSN